MITSAGYDGSVNEPQWSALLSMSGGRQYGVRDAASWVASIGSGDRQLVLSAGAGFGYGVADESDEPETLTLAPVSSGSRWDLIVMRRDWGANESSFEVVQGTSTAQLPERETGPADLDDQPLWLARVQAGSSQVMQLIDLRVWGGDGGALAQHELVLQYLNRLGTVVRVGRAVWSRVIDSIGTPTWVKSSGDQPVGSILAFAGSAAPDGWLMCAGQSVSRTDYPELFAVIGTTYGGADTPTAFNLPNMSGRVAVGVSTEPEFNSRGKTGGAKTHALTANEGPSHTHTQSPHNHYIDGPIGGQLSGSNGSGPGGSGGGYAPWFGGGFGAQPARVTQEQPAIQASGGGAPHNNLQPYLALPHIIKAL